ncbi:Sodium/hydrogen exchanger isoform 1 [Hibiscus syriacus]|uniref:Sodium/hydrogen exchanger isoform 1 n=1 Tax=Hibiscus syriacus TaxID=106335 RepID=A0A6A2ZS66_HIBSY|nr:protein NETWORKED 3C-like [Hibiscus syriacus]KAE8693755.1 Sodium/hydrogen exchanger isoform 1 [Hibiscus syriacus]
MAQTMKMEAPRWWWFDTHNRGSKRSPWLHSTLSELEHKTKTMLKLIEEDADSFAQRAEMYYKKRPELISLVQDLYRAHRSLAERYDQVKTGILGSSSSMKSNSGKTINVMDITYDSHSDNAESEDSPESEVDDPKHDGIYEVPSIVTEDDEIMKLKEEIGRLKEENKNQKAQLLQKDTEKRQVIRELSFAVQLLKDDNIELEKSISKQSSTPSRKRSPLEFSRLKGGFLGMLFNGSPMSRATAIAL